MSPAIALCTRALRTFENRWLNPGTFALAAAAKNESIRLCLSLVSHIFTTGSKRSSVCVGRHAKCSPQKSRRASRSGLPHSNFSRDASTLGFA